MTQTKKKTRLRLSANKSAAKQLFVRANVTNDKESWETVPGELLKEYNDNHIYLRKPMTSVQSGQPRPKFPQ
jgi:molecular chaperone DnaK